MSTIRLTRIWRDHVKDMGGEEGGRRGTGEEEVNILKGVEENQLKGSAAPVDTESLPVLRVGHSLSESYKKTVQTHTHKHTLYIHQIICLTHKPYIELAHRRQMCWKLTSLWKLWKSNSTVDGKSELSLMVRVKVGFRAENFETKTLGPNLESYGLTLKYLSAVLPWSLSGSTVSKVSRHGSPKISGARCMHCFYV